MSEFKRTHLNFNCKDIGLVLLKQYSYLGATPDLIVECTWCGRGVVEIKCLSSIAGEKPLCKNYSHLEVTEKGDCILKQTGRIFIKCTTKWQQLNQNTVNFLYTKNMDLM